MILFYNTLSREKEEFKPVVKGKVGLYTCGPTVYNYAHIGNFRSYLFEDLLKRWLEFRGFGVNHVMNLTDVDDKTIRDSRKEGKTLEEFTEFYSQKFFEDLSALGIKPASSYPRATDFVKEMVEITQELLEKGIAYKGEDDSIYYSISKFPSYGKLALLDSSGLKSGARVKQDDYAKESVSDFALWKKWDESDGDVFWETPLGKGRPGWHIECTAMSTKLLGETFDIHCGGIDLIFPHHTNEIAQTEGWTGKKFVNYWLHNEFLLVSGEKMSKRFHNFYTLRDLEEKGFNPIAFRYLCLTANYRSKLNFTFEALSDAQKTIEKLSDFAVRVEGEIKTAKEGNSDKLSSAINVCRRNFGEALDDDLDSPRALAELHKLVSIANKEIDSGKLGKGALLELLDFLKEVNEVLGVIEFANDSGKNALTSEEEQLLQEREEARVKKDFKKADELRAKLKSLGIELQDGAGGKGVSWKRVKQAKGA
jgi:cysteinyl-tRNA synthetase